jgi:uncharacterized membrane protein YdbT with pleckstrin-like domain
MPNPLSQCRFPNQHQDEEVLRVIHRHWFNILSHFFIILIFSFLLVASFLAFPILFPEMFNDGSARLFLFVENTFFIFIWLFSFLIWIDYYFDIWIITNERIINIEQKGLFVRHISELNFQNVQDVTSTVDGLLPTILNYGDVSVQTAGAENRFLFRQVPDPYQVKDLVMNLAKNANNKPQ